MPEVATCHRAVGRGQLAKVRSATQGFLGELLRDGGRAMAEVRREFDRGAQRQISLRPAESAGGERECGGWESRPFDRAVDR